MIKKSKALRLIDAPFYNYLQAMVLSFYSAKLYVDVGKRWRGFGILYLLLLIIIVTIPFAMRMSADFNYYFDMDILQPLKKIPKMYVQNGKVSLDKPMPYLIRNERGQVVSIIDTTGRINKIDSSYPYLSTLITQDKVIYRLPKPHFFFDSTGDQGEGPIYIQPLSPDMNQVVEGKELVTSFGIERVRLLSNLIIYPTVVLMFFVVYLIFFLALGLMAQFVAKLFLKLSISYQQACRLLMVASTPQLVVFLLFLTLNAIFYGFGLIVISILAIYFSFAVIALKRESNKLVTS